MGTKYKPLLRLLCLTYITIAVVPLWIDLALALNIWQTFEVNNMLDLTTKHPRFKMAIITTLKFLKDLIFLSLPVLYIKDLMRGMKNFIIKQHIMAQMEKATSETDCYTTFVGG